MKSGANGDQMSPKQHLAPVVQKLDNAIHHMNRYPVDNCWQNKSRYPLDGDLCGGWLDLQDVKFQRLLYLTTNITITYKVGQGVAQSTAL